MIVTQPPTNSASDTSVITVKCFSVNKRQKSVIYNSLTQKKHVASHQADFLFYCVYLSINSINLQMPLKTTISVGFLNYLQVHTQLPPLSLNKFEEQQLLNT